MSKLHTFIPIRNEVMRDISNRVYAHRDLTMVNPPNQPRLSSTESVSYARERSEPQITRLSIDSPCLT